MKIKTYYLVISFCALFVSCKKEVPNNKVTITKSEIKQTADSILTQWHLAATKADFDSYFNLMTQDAIFIGTDASENWNIKVFKEFSKPYFDAGQAWNFSALERHIFVSDDNQTIWFDELLDTWMKLCRGSGVLKQENGQWKIAHYVLSVTVPNEEIDALIEIKKQSDSITVEKLKKDSN